MCAAASEPVDAFLARYKPAPGQDWVTLTFAQSSDGKIAGENSQTVRISGDASMALTHRLREHHDAILVGIGTVLNDDPQLNVRLASPAPKHPRPVVLDDDLRTPLTSRLLRNLAEGNGRPPLLLAATPHHAADISEWSRRREMLTHAGAEVALVDADGQGQLTWAAIRAKLQELQLHSVMVEGGAAVINNLLAAHAAGQTQIQTALITVSPKAIGPKGLGYSATLPLDGGASNNLTYTEALELTPDRVVALRG